MRVVIDGCIRGEPVKVIWDDGAVSGDSELVRRARAMGQVRRNPIDETDAAQFISALEEAVGGRVTVTVYPDGAEPLADATGTMTSA